MRRSLRRGAVAETNACVVAQWCLAPKDKSAVRMGRIYPFLTATRQLPESASVGRSDVDTLTVRPAAREGCISGDIIYTTSANSVLDTGCVPSQARKSRTFDRADVDSLSDGLIFRVKRGFNGVPKAKEELAWKTTQQRAAQKSRA